MQNHSLFLQVNEAQSLLLTAWKEKKSHKNSAQHGQPSQTIQQAGWRNKKPLPDFIKNP